MSDNDLGIRCLDALLKAASNLKKLDGINEDFVTWHLSLVTRVTYQFGRNSREIVEVQRLQFEVEPESIDAWLARAPLDDELIKQAKVMRYRKGLTEAEELIRTFLWQLKRRQQ